MVPRPLVASLLAACLLLAGCTAPAEKPAPAPAAVGMGGGGMGGAAGESSGMVEGVVAASKNAILEVGSASTVTSEGVLLARVVAPSDGWAVVNSTVAPGRPLGMTWVPKGVSRNVLVKLINADGPRTLVTLHVDRGAARVWEFDPERALRSPDAQVFVNRTPVAAALTLSAFGVYVLSNTALMRVEDQKSGARSIRVAYLLVPSPSWISVAAVEDGLPADVLGRTWRAAGEYQEILVPLDEVSSQGEVLVTMHADAGTPSLFEFDPTDPLGSSDQPFRSAGEIVSKQIRLKAR